MSTTSKTNVVIVFLIILYSTHKSFLYSTKSHTFIQSFSVQPFNLLYYCDHESPMGVAILVFSKINMRYDWLF